MNGLRVPEKFFKRISEHPRRPEVKNPFEYFVYFVVQPLRFLRALVLRFLIRVHPALSVVKAVVSFAVEFPRIPRPPLLNAVIQSRNASVGNRDPSTESLQKSCSGGRRVKAADSEGQ